MTNEDQDVVDAIEEDVADESMAPVDEVVVAVDEAGFGDAPVDTIIENEDDTVPAEPVEAADEALTTDDSDADMTVADVVEADTDDGLVDPMVEFRASLLMQDGDWYVIHSYSGHEKRVKQAIEHRVVSLNM